MDALHGALDESRRHSQGLAQRGTRLEAQVACLGRRCQEAEGTLEPAQVRGPRGQGPAFPLQNHRPPRQEKRSRRRAFTPGTPDAQTPQRTDGETEAGGSQRPEASPRVSGSTARAPRTEGRLWTRSSGEESG